MVDKQYMVSEEELVEFLFSNYYTDIYFEEAEREIQSFLKSKTPIEPSDDANLFPNARSMTKEEVQREKEYEAKHSKIINISEPSDDAKKFGKQLQRGLEKTRFEGWEQGKKQCTVPYNFTLADDAYIEGIWKDLMSKLPQPKQFSRGEVWNIVEELVADESGAVFQEKVIEYTDRIMTLIPKQFNEAEIRKICVGILLPPLGNVPVMHILGQINVLVRNLATLTPKAQGEVNKCQ